MDSGKPASSARAGLQPIAVESAIVFLSSSRYLAVLVARYIGNVTSTALHLPMSCAIIQRMSDTGSIGA